MPQQQYNKETTTEKKQEDWMNSKWRPMMGWMYMAICLFDFMLAPVLWSVLQAIGHGGVTTQWQPLTLQGAGLFHVAMGAVIGISAYGRTQEKLNGAEAGGLGAGTTYVPPNATTVNTITQGNQPSFTPTSSFTPPAPSVSVNVTAPSSPTPPIFTNASGKKLVPKNTQPEL